MKQVFKIVKKKGIARETNNNIKGFEEDVAHDDDKSDDLHKLQSLTATAMNPTLSHSLEPDEPASIDLRILLQNLSSEMQSEMIESCLDIKKILVKGRQDHAFNPLQHTTAMGEG